MKPNVLNFHSHSPEAPILSLSPEEYLSYEGHPDQVITVGIHPYDAHNDQLSSFEILARAFADPRLVAVGEIGVDPTADADIERQLFIARTQAKHAINAGLPIVFHIVRRCDLLVAMHKEMRPRQPWAVHGFRGKPEAARQLAAEGIYMSLGLRFNPEAVKLIPDDLLLVETDTLPDDRINDVLAAVAETRGTTPERIATLARANLARFFSVPVKKKA